MQAVEIVDGIARFRANAAVRALVDWGRDHGMSLNDLETRGFPAEDMQQLMQLIGYSVSGYGNVPYVTPESVKVADARVERLLAGQAKAALTPPKGRR